MQHEVEILTRQTPEVLERVLRVTRHRGFNVQNMQMDKLEAEQKVSIRLHVESQRPLHLLTNQLTKLVDVAAVIAQESASAQKTISTTSTTSTTVQAALA